MTKQVDVKEIERQAYETLSQDGFSQIQIGLIIVGLAMVGVFRGESFFAEFGFAIFFGFYSAIISILIKFLQKRITQPRIGYVKTKMGKRNRMALFILAAVFFMLILIVFIIEIDLSHHPINMFVFIIPFSGGALVGGHIYHDRLWLKLTAFYLIYGVGLFLIPFLDFETKMRLMFAGFGIITLITGIIRLHRFLKNHPRTAKETAHVSQR